MKRPSFQFYPTDWLSDHKVASMTPAQRGGYIQMLCHMWNTDTCSLPNDEMLWQSLSGLTDKDLRVVQGCFNQMATGENSLVHKRLNKEREKQDFWRRKSVEGGKKSGKIRQQKAKSKGGSRVVEPKGNHSVSTITTTSSTLSSSLDNAKALQPAADKKEYGNENINNVLKAIKLHTGLEDFTESQKEQRIWGNHLYQLMSKIQPLEFGRRLDILCSDSFKAKRCNSLRFLYSEIKAFIEPKSQGIFIS